MHQILSWVSVLIIHCCGCGVNWIRTITKVPQALHRLRSGCYRGHQLHGLMDESLPRHCIQNSSLQDILHQDVLGDVLTIQGIYGSQVDGQHSCILWHVGYLEVGDSLRNITISVALQPIQCLMHRQTHYCVIIIKVKYLNVLTSLPICVFLW